MTSRPATPAADTATLPERPHEIADLPIGELIVDRSVQRAFDPRRAAKIADDFDINAISVFSVSLRRDGSKHTVDGQHRTGVLRALGYPETYKVPCRIYRGLTKAEEAAMFRRLNNTKAITPIDKFRVRVEEGEPVAVALHDMLTHYGWRLSSGSRIGAFSAVSTLETLYRGPDGKQENLTVCERTIGVITKAWGHVSQGVQQEIVAGLGALFLRYGDGVDIPKLAQELGGAPGGPRAFRGRAVGYRDMSGGTVADAVATLAVNMLNKGRRSRLVPTWVPAAIHDRETRQERRAEEAAKVKRARQAQQIALPIDGHR